MQADESLRNNEAIKKGISDNLMAKADQAEAVLELLKQIRHITDGPLWQDDKVPFCVYSLFLAMEQNTPSKLRASAANDTYLGNAAAFGRKL